MRPITILLLVGAIAIGVGTYGMDWFTQKSGPNTIKLRPGQISVCSPDGECTKSESDGADYDSTWLGITNACKIAAGLGILACGAAAAMAQARKTQLGSGGTAIKKTHAMFAALIGMGLSAASALMVPMGLDKGNGIFVALAGYAVAVAGSFLLSDDAPRNPTAPLPPPRRVS